MNLALKIKSEKFKHKLFNSLELKTWDKTRTDISANVRDKILTNSNRVTEQVYIHVRNYYEAYETNIKK